LLQENSKETKLENDERVLNNKNFYQKFWKIFQGKMQIFRPFGQFAWT
jgi:hypothetical protein